MGIERPKIPLPQDLIKLKEEAIRVNGAGPKDWEQITGEQPGVNLASVPGDNEHVNGLIKVGVLRVVHESHEGTVHWRKIVRRVAPVAAGVVGAAGVAIIAYEVAKRRRRKDPSA